MVGRNAIILLGSFVLLFLLLLGANWQKWSEYRELGKEIDQLETQIDEKGAIAAELPALRERKANLEDTLGQLVSILPRESEGEAQGSMIEMVTRIDEAQGSNLRMMQYSPVEEETSRRAPSAGEVQSELFSKYSVDLELRGTFVAFLRFLYEIEAAERFRRIDEFDLQPVSLREQEEMEATEGQRVLDIGVRISTYSYTPPTGEGPGT